MACVIVGSTPALALAGGEPPLVDVDGAAAPARSGPPADPAFPVAPAPRGLAAAEQYKGWTVSSLRVDGLPAELAKELEGGLALSGESRLLGTRRPPLFVNTLRDDLVRSRLFLARHGYPRASIEPRFAPQGRAERVAVVLAVDPGMPVLVDSLSVSGLPDDLQDQGTTALTLAPGMRLDDAKVQASTAALESLLQKDGYPHARVTAGVAMLDSTRVVLTFAAQPGPLSRFGTTHVDGASGDLVPLVRKTIAVKRGSLYTPVVMQRANEALRSLGLFRQIQLDLQDAAPGTVDVRANLLPRKPQTVEIGVGYWTDDFLRASARWQHRNLLHAGRGLEIHGNVSRFRQAAGVAISWPALLGAHTKAMTLLDVTNENEDSYDLTNTQWEMAATHQFSLATSLRLGIALSNVDVRASQSAAGSFVEQGGLLTFLSALWSRDRSDDRLYPTRGTVAWIKSEWTPPGWLSDAHYISGHAAVAAYHELLPGAVAAGRLEIAMAAPTGGSVDLLPNKRFYAGGPSSMRGAGRHELGPLDAAGDPLGGEAMALTSAELRLPLYRLFRWALFADLGQVWLRRRQISLRGWEIAVGPGLMVRTPVGPMRADVATNLTPRPPGKPRTLLQIAVGQPF